MTKILLARQLDADGLITREGMAKSNPDDLADWWTASDWLLKGSASRR